MISLRPVGGHAALRRAAAREGARVIALSPWKLQRRDDAATRAALRAALAADVVVATSPAAVAAARALGPLRQRRGQQWFAIGTGTARALGRAGIGDVQVPVLLDSVRMDSEGLLALPGLRAVRGRSAGLLTAPGGRDRIAPALRRRGATVHRADVYARVEIEPAPRSLSTLRSLRAPAWLALSSGEALRCLLAKLPADVAARVRQARVVAASPRLAGLAQQAGFAGVVVAASAMPRDLMAAATTGTRARDRSASMRGSGPGDPT